MKKAGIILTQLLLLNACAAIRTDTDTDSLSLFRQLTQGKTELSIRSGEPSQFSGSEKFCVSATCNKNDKNCKKTDHFNDSPLMAGSDFVKYYGLSTGKDGYSHYSETSQYAKDVAELSANMDRLMRSFRQTGLREELVRQGLTPALMFDIDNTLEFSAAPDSDSTGNGPAIKGMVDFAKRWCFKDDVVCYFITARNCDVSSVGPTEKWLKANLGLTDERIRRYTHFSRNSQDLTCSIPNSPTVAYKDVIREALEQQEKVFWLMSVGDQLTDSLGRHSGMKVRVPNQFFHSDIVPNQYAPWGAGQCNRPLTIAPPKACADSLLDKAVKYSSLDYCRSQPAAND